jgi:hypothetical protein
MSGGQESWESSVARLRGAVTASRGIDLRDPDLLLWAADEITRLNGLLAAYAAGQAATVPKGPWYVGAMNDGLFIIDQPPSPAPVDHVSPERHKDATILARIERREDADRIVATLNSYAAGQAGGGEWQDIETAPRDGTPVMVASAPDQWVCAAYYETDGDRGWYQESSHWTDAHDGSCRPTHWMPQPKPPLPPQTSTRGKEI